MIETSHIKKYYGSDLILDDINIRIKRNDKIGIVGRNGAGKTTLIRILSGEDDDYHGKIVYEGKPSINYVEQFFSVQNMSALDYMIEPFLQMRDKLRSLEECMANEEGKTLEKTCAEYGDLRTLYDSKEGDEAEQRAIVFLENLGLDKCMDSELRVLSGGEKNILAMGRANVLKSDVLILDEPGNHLDIKGLAWLENFINSYSGAVIIVSHNRYLLDRVCTSIIELDNGKAQTYTGNYSAYRLEKLRTTVSSQMTYNAEQKKIAQLEEVVRRFAEIAKRTCDPKWGKRLRSRRTQLAKFKERSIEKPVNPVTSFEVAFTKDVSRAHIALRVNSLTCAYGERVLLKDADFLITTGERCALVGLNGSGKTTLIKEIQRLSLEQDERVFIGPSLKTSYCSQYGETLDKENTIFEECMKAGCKTEDEAFKTLSRFLFTRASLTQKVGSLSGGEMNKLQLALSVIKEADFLILDEPTNHLDIPSCEAIEDALLDFKGTILAVSHDRYFLDRIAQRVLEISDCALNSWEGNFSEFWYSRYGSQVERSIQKVISKNSVSSVEEKIIALEKEKKDAERSMGEYYTKGDLVKARSMGNKLDRITREIERLYSEWE